MQTIIKKTGRIRKKDSIVCMTHSVASIPDTLITDEEKQYVNHHYKKHNTSQFSFNYIDFWRFVIIIDEKGAAYDILEKCRRAGSEIVDRINACKLNEVVLMDTSEDPLKIMALAEGISLGNYQFIKYKTKEKDSLNSLSGIRVYSRHVGDKLIDEMNILNDAGYKCRDMVNEPLSTLNAGRFAEIMADMSEKAGVKAEIFNRKKIESLKMGGLLAVNKGSLDPPTFTVMEWKPAKHKNKKPLVLTGKGVVYDTGGMNLKTGNYMNDMKSDMAGGAAVASAIYAAGRMNLPVWVIALVPATDNRVDGNAFVSGDVIRMYNGSTVEVINTDAEGRMILADALSYAAKYKPELVINLATLTGSASRATGKYGMVGMHHRAGIQMNRLERSGRRVYERIAEFPFWDEYSELLKSDVADIKNIGGADAGAITAGKFLQHFAEFPFIHLDIAGTAFVTKKDSYRGKGATASGLRLLIDFIKNYQE